MAISGLVLSFVPAPEPAVAEMARILRPGGTLAAYLWDYTPGGMELIRYFWEAAVSLDEGSRKLDEALRLPLCAPGPLGEFLRAAGLADVEVDEINIPTRFRDFDDYGAPCLGGQGHAPPESHGRVSRCRKGPRRRSMRRGPFRTVRQRQAADRRICKLQKSAIS
ncbi:methyltransferase domain-containing protein [Streptomyces sp. A0592]|uniref:methyltransferase domain-containing protein n=1 Tax=Streptomyces sp. A0592 TaxID=2563099 RepID=UPI00109EC2AE|nr:methyltransferase domain-containing protein [Streptomyces sp. A0592]THA82615.1 hypothetical protein E6U81_18835 [Streptomyces sp. A0592]